MRKLFLILTITAELSYCNLYSQVNCDTIIPPPGQSNYILPYPVGKTYCIIQGNCSTGGHANLFALDFNTQLGDTISACRSGIVVFVNQQYSDSDWVNGHENNVFIQHSDGTRIRYTHLKQYSVFVSAGQFVTAGQPLALSGSSGNTGGNPHLHLQAFRDGTSYNGFNSIPLNFSNTTDSVNSHNMCVSGVCYTANNPLFISPNYNTTPDKFKLYQNYPNPFNPSTKIKFEIPITSIVSFSIYDISGKEVFNFSDRELQAGTYEYLFDGKDISGGIYFFNLRSHDFVETKKMILIK